MWSHVEGNNIFFNEMRTSLKKSKIPVVGFDPTSSGL